MNEVEKMYENAGIEHEGLEWICQNPDHCTYQNLSIIPENCSGCEYFEKERIYPPFTAEKQLKILCFIINNKYRTLFHNKVFTGGTLTLEKLQKDLVWAIDRIWQEGITEEEKQQVKEILE